YDKWHQQRCRSHRLYILGRYMNSFPSSVKIISFIKHPKSFFCGNWCNGFSRSLHWSCFFGNNFSSLGLWNDQHALFACVLLLCSAFSQILGCCFLHIGRCFTDNSLLTTANSNI